MIGTINSKARKPEVIIAALVSIHETGLNSGKSSQGGEP